MIPQRSRRHLVVYTDATMIAGAEHSLATLIEHLPPWVEVTAAGPDRRTLSKAIEGRPAAKLVVTPPLAAKGDLLNGPKLRRTLAELRPSAIHLNKTEVGGLRYVEGVIRTLPNVRVVSVVHHIEPPGTTPARLISRRLARGTDAIVAVSDALARQLETVLARPHGTVHVIPNALPLPPVWHRPTDDRFVVGALARFVPHKAVDDLIAAVAANDDAHLLLGGDGPERQRLERLAWRLGVASRVEFLGWVDPQDVMANCDIVASAARVEGHPMTLLDARRRGLPVVATDVGGVGEIVEDGVTGLLVPPGHVTGLAKAIARLAGDRRLRTEMAAAARAAAAAAPGPTAMAEAYCDLYWPEPGRQTRPRSTDRRNPVPPRNRLDRRPAPVDPASRPA